MCCCMHNRMVGVVGAIQGYVPDCIEQSKRRLVSFRKRNETSETGRFSQLDKICLFVNPKLCNLFFVHDKLADKALYLCGAR